MSKTLFGLAASALLLLSTARAQVVWQDHFDTYSLGPLAAQSDWDEWYSGSNTDCDVTTAFAFSGTKSIKVTGPPTYTNPTDVVYQFSQLPGGLPVAGQWLFSIRTYIATGSKGVGYFIMMNQYGGPDSWSIEIKFRPNVGDIYNDGKGHQSIPIVFDKWIELRAYIDLDNDKVYVFYGDTIFINGESWKDGISGGGLAQIAAVDLYGGAAGNPIKEMYYDDAQIEKVDKFPVVLNSAPNPVHTGDTINLTTMAPTLPNATAALFVWDINGVPVIHLLAVGTIDITGKWTLSGPVVSGLSGLDINFRTLVVGPLGGTIQGQKELVQFR
ncbi:MAG: hypothetical protein U1E76_02980 [Planctomycetota bacterium]